MLRAFGNHTEWLLYIARDVLVPKVLKTEDTVKGQRSIHRKKCEVTFVNEGRLDPLTFSWFFGIHIDASVLVLTLSDWLFSIPSVWLAPSARICCYTPEIGSVSNTVRFYGRTPGVKNKVLRVYQTKHNKCESTVPFFTTLSPLDISHAVSSWRTVLLLSCDTMWREFQPVNLLSSSLCRVRETTQRPTPKGHCKARTLLSRNRQCGTLSPPTVTVLERFRFKHTFRHCREVARLAASFTRTPCSTFFLKRRHFQSRTCTFVDQSQKISKKVKNQKNQSQNWSEIHPTNRNVSFVDFRKVYGKHDKVVTL